MAALESSSSALPGRLVRRRTRLSRQPLGARADAAISIRRLQPGDYAGIAATLDRWSRGRFIGLALPRSFLEHFGNTSLLLMENGNIAGVLIGFRSQTEPRAAYVHLVAVAANSRRRGHGRALYQHFFELVAALGCAEVHAIAPPVNSALIAFHRQMGFDVIDAGGFSCGIAVSPDFAGPGQHRVLFRKKLD